MRRTVRSDVDFVITFEELDAMFIAKDIEFDDFKVGEPMEDATRAGRGYAVAGGVAKAIEACIEEYYPGTEVHIEHAESLTECKKMLMLAKAGKKNGCLIEGMACPGGCVAGAGTNIAVPPAPSGVNKFKNAASRRVPLKEGQ
jgi:iron only hydrogenase large subunit-like protein